MRYAGTRRSKHNPLRSIPLVQTAAVLFGPSKTDHLVGELRDALWDVAGYVRAYNKARIALGKANGHNKEWRRDSQRYAMRALNIARGAMKTNARKVAVLQAKLLALAVPSDLWAVAAASAQAAV